MTEPSWPGDRRVTVRDLQAATDRGERWAMLTSYDALTAGSATLLRPGAVRVSTAGRPRAVSTARGSASHQGLAVPPPAVAAAGVGAAHRAVWPDWPGSTSSH